MHATVRLYSPHFNIERFPFMETALEMRALFQISLKSLPPFGFQPSNSPIRREKSAQSKSMAQDEGIEQYTDLNVSMCPVWVKVEMVQGTHGQGWTARCSIKRCNAESALKS